MLQNSVLGRGASPLRFPRGPEDKDPPQAAAAWGLAAVKSPVAGTDRTRSFRVGRGRDSAGHSEESPGIVGMTVALHSKPSAEQFIGCNYELEMKTLFYNNNNVTFLI